MKKISVFEFSTNKVILATYIFVAGVALALLILMLRYQSFAQSEQRSNITGAAPVAKGLFREATADGEAYLYEEMAGLTRETIRDLELPKVWLTFQPETGMGSSRTSPRIELPTEARAILDRQWRISVEYYLATEYNLKPDDRTMEMSPLARTDTVNRERGNLMRLQIDLPGETRNISKDEAMSLIIYVNRAAYNLVRRVREAEFGLTAN